MRKSGSIKLSRPPIDTRNCTVGPKSMFHYAIGMLPLTEKVQAEHGNTVTSFFVDDLTLGARTCPFAKSFSTVNWYGPSIIRCGGCKVLRHLHGSR